MGIIPNEQISRYLHQRVSELFLLTYAGHILSGSFLENEEDGEPVICVRRRTIIRGRSDRW